MNIICPYCKHDHIEEAMQELDAWIGEKPYETQCSVCERYFVVQAIMTFEFHTHKTADWRYNSDT